MTTQTTRTLSFEEVSVGDELPALEIPITATLIVSGALATRDFQDVHHDRDLAQEKGSPDIFMNILTSNGLVCRFVTDWAGPEALVRKIAIRLGAPNYPGDTMTMTGAVSSKEEAPADSDGVLEVQVRGQNSLGDHVSGTVEIALPRSA